MSNKEQLQENNETLESVLYALANNPTATELQMNLDQHKVDTENPHGVTKDQVGLGNVPNVVTNDQTPTYTEVSTLTALTSGEKLATAFGKIAKAVSELISHITNKSNPHNVTTTQIGAAPTSHEHSTVDITSGTLPTTRGGTGRDFTSVPPNAIVRKISDGTTLTHVATGNGALYATATNGLPTFGTLPVAQGGTGATTVNDARANLGINYTIYKSLTEIGLSGKVTMNQVCSALPQYSCLMVSNSTSSSNSISDAPCSYGFIEIIKNGIYGHARATRGGSTSYEFYLGAYYGASDGAYQGFSGWTRMMPNVLTAYEHGTTLPTAGNKGRMYYKKVSN
jgi:hypothetical protein